MDQSYGIDIETILDSWCHSPPVPLAERHEKTEWSWNENKMFENVVAQVDPTPPDLFRKIAYKIPGKTIEQIEKHYYALIEDVLMIESGLVPLPDYKDKNANECGDNRSTKRKKDGKSSKEQRKKGVPWTKEEHERFLMGLEKYGKGDWRSISRHCVVTRTPIQIASHAQKYFLRLQRASRSTKSSA